MSGDVGAEVERVDRYTIKVNGARVRATEDQEQRLRQMSPKQIEDFLSAMGVAARCLREGTCHYYGDPCSHCNALSEKYEGWEPWEGMTWD